MKYLKIPIYALAAIFVATPTLVFAEEPFEEGRIFFELNDTDGDLGIHGKIDGGPWKKMEIEDPNERTLMKVTARSKLKDQGLTELFFESAEPCFPIGPECDEDEFLDPDDFLARFPQGIYEIEGTTLDGDELENEVYVSHIIPAAPAMVTIKGATETASQPAAANCDAPVLPAVDPTEGVTISWVAVDSSHAVLGRNEGTLFTGLSHTPNGAPVPVEVLSYEVVVEVDETPFVTVAIVPSDTTEWTFSEDFFDLSDEDEYKFEILVRINNGQNDVDGNPIPGNKSAVESCFEVE